MQQGPVETCDGLPIELEMMYFVGRREILKPVLIKDPVGDIVAVSESGLGGKMHVFTKNDIHHIPEMKTIETPDWVKK